jgi:hypothetical protein
VDWRDRTIGITVGVVLGVGVVVTFVFVLSDETVDAPSLSGVSTTSTPTKQRPRGSPPRSKPTPAPAPSPATVRVIGGAPPAGGPVELHYRPGAETSLRVITDSTVELRVTGYGVRRTVQPGQSDSTFNFEATRAGTFAVIVAGSHIDVARITVGGGSP